MRICSPQERSLRVFFTTVTQHVGVDGRVGYRLIDDSILNREKQELGARRRRVGQPDIQFLEGAASHVVAGSPAYSSRNVGNEVIAIRALLLNDAHIAGMPTCKN